jgi:hypothetical protein
MKMRQSDRSSAKLTSADRIIRICVSMVLVGIVEISPAQGVGADLHEIGQVLQWPPSWSDGLDIIKIRIVVRVACEG